MEKVSQNIFAQPKNTLEIDTKNIDLKSQFSDQQSISKANVINKDLFDQLDYSEKSIIEPKKSKNVCQSLNIS